MNASTTSTTTKVCSVCGSEKNLSEFYKHKSGKYGVVAPCIICWKQNVKTYRDSNTEKIKERKRLERIKHKEYYKEYKSKYYIENKEALLLQSSEYRLTHKEEQSIRDKEYYIENKEKIKSRERKYYLENRDSVLITTNKYRNNHKEKISDYNKYYRTTPVGKENRSLDQIRRRTKEKSVECTLTRKQWNDIILMQNNRCADCNQEFDSKLKPTKDHIIPLSRGGGLTFGNVQALCGSCNSKKHANIDFLKMSILFTDEVTT